MHRYRVRESLLAPAGRQSAGSNGGAKSEGEVLFLHDAQDWPSATSIATTSKVDYL